MTKVDPLIEFVQNRINEVKDEGVRKAYSSIAGIAIGCPGCGKHGGPPHACPGRLGRPDGGWLNTGDEYNPWANILRKLAFIWRDHPKYSSQWNLELTPFEICERYADHMYAWNSDQQASLCLNCGFEEPALA